MFPRSLFLLDLNNLTTAREHLALFRTALDQSLQALTLTVLHSAWNMSRQRDFQARMFLRLSAIATRRHELEAQRALKRTDLEKSVIDLSRTTIRIPFTGRISLLEAELQQYVRIGDRLVTAVAIDKVEIRV